MTDRLFALLSLLLCLFVAGNSVAGDKLRRLGGTVMELGEWSNGSRYAGIYLEAECPAHCSAWHVSLKGKSADNWAIRGVSFYSDEARTEKVRCGVDFDRSDDSHRAGNIVAKPQTKLFVKVEFEALTIERKPVRTLKDDVQLSIMPDEGPAE